VQPPPARAPSSHEDTRSAIPSDRRAIVFPSPSERLAATGERFTPGTPGEIEHEHYHRYLFALELCAGRDVLDVASGEGYGSALLATRARTVIGVELDPAVVAHAASSYAAPGLTFRVGDCAALPVETASVDVVVSFETLEHITEQARFLAEIERVLRPDGLLVLSSPVRGVYSPEKPNPFHQRELTREELEELIGSRFRHSAWLGQTPVVGSALLADAPPPGLTPGQLYWRRGEGGGFDPIDGIGPSPYLLVVASDGPLPALRTGLLQDRPYMARLLADVRDARDEARARGAELEQARRELAEVRVALQAEVEKRHAERQARHRELEAHRAALSARDTELRRLRETLGAARRLRGLRRLWDSLRRRLVVRRIAASGLFDAGYYRRTSPPAGDGPDPIRHYVKYGAAYGRNPHPMFDTSFYLREHPDVARRGVNPLLHFIASGAARGLRPHPLHTAGEYLAAARTALLPAPAAAGQPPRRAPRDAPESTAQWRFEPRPIVVGTPAAPVPAAPPAAATLVVSHVLPYPPRAGNEYRIHRLVRWLRSEGHEVHLVVCPLPGELLDPALVARAAQEYANLVVCERDGVVRYRCDRPEARAAIVALAGHRPATFPDAARGSRDGERIARIEETFCPDPLLDVLVRLSDAIEPGVIVSSYVFMSRSLGLLRREALKVIDTHDVFSTKGRKVVQFGVADDLALSPDEERAMLRRADLLVAIQPDEERELRELAPDRRVVTAGVDFELAGSSAEATDPVVLCVASSNAMNVRGMRDFISLAWPLVRQEVPGARLHVVGPVCDAVDPGVEGVELLGRVDKLDDAYARARVVINPALAGTGLKIKTLEALSHLRPIVVWPSGVDGLGPEARRLCHVSRDWYDFGRQVVRLLSTAASEEVEKHRDELARVLSADSVYAALRAALEERPAATARARRGIGR
jgi:SAM-dependent methyltransferase